MLLSCHSWTPFAIKIIREIQLRNNNFFVLIYGFIILEDAGITPTEQDIEDINKGDIPSSLRIDAVHLTTKANQLVGKRIFEKGKILGYW